jgi:hypothetical protein
LELIIMFARLTSMLLVAGALWTSGAALPSSGARADDSAPPPVPGSWEKRQYSFVFMGFTSTYSCDGLADKLKTLLLTAGARADAKSLPGACANGFGRPDKFATAYLTFYTLVPNGTAAAGDAKPVDGNWKEVRLSALSPRQLQLGDCELVEQFRNNVLPLLSTRNVENNMTCIPHQLSGSQIDLKFETFAAVPKKPAAAPATARTGA